MGTLTAVNRAADVRYPRIMPRFETAALVNVSRRWRWPRFGHALAAHDASSAARISSATRFTMKFRGFVLAAMVALGACASTQRTLSYSAGWPDADVYVGESRYQIWFHERDQTVLVVRGDPRPLGQLMAENLTIYSQDRSPGILVWGAAANAVLTQFGCYGTEVTGSDQMREIAYTCPQPVDVGAEVAARRDEWRRGVRVPAPAA